MCTKACKHQPSNSKGSLATPQEIHTQKENNIRLWQLVDTSITTTLRMA